MVTVVYKGNTIATINKGQCVTLACYKDLMESDISVNVSGDNEDPVYIVYKGRKIAKLSPGQAKKLLCSGKLMRGDVKISVVGESEGEKTYTLTLKNIGNCRLSYNADTTGYTGSTTLYPGETATITDIKEFVWCGSQVDWEKADSTFENCTVEWSSSTCLIYLTGDNAVANVYTYD